MGEQLALERVTGTGHAWAAKAGQLSREAFGKNVLDSFRFPYEASVLVREDALVGFVYFSLPEEGETPSAQVHFLAVDASMQRHGYGRMLLGYVQFRCIELDIPCMVVDPCGDCRQYFLALDFTESESVPETAEPFSLDAGDRELQDHAEPADSGCLEFYCDGSLQGLNYTARVYTSLNATLLTRKGPAALSRQTREWVSTYIALSGSAAASVDQGAPEWIRWLLSDVLGLKATSPIMHATLNGDCESIRRLSEQGVSLQRTVNPFWHIEPLAVAAYFGQLHVTVTLIECSVDPLRPCMNDFVTPLFLARKEGHGELVRFLLEYTRRVSDDDGRIREGAHVTRAWRNLQEGFLKVYGAQLQQELGDDVVLSRVTPDLEVQSRFLLSLQGQVPLLGYHGTKARNVKSISLLGLMLPDTGGPAVKNGYYDIVGIYAAKAGSSRMARAYCDSDALLVCGVCDDGEDSKRVLHITASAVLIYDEAMVAPLFVASHVKGLHRPRARKTGKSGTPG